MKKLVEQTWIQARLDALGKSQAEVGRVLGLDRSIISKMINAGRRITAIEIKALAPLLEMSESACYQSVLNGRFIAETDSILGAELPAGDASRGYVVRQENGERRQSDRPAPLEQEAKTMDSVIGGKWRSVCNLIAEKSFPIRESADDPARELAVAIWADALYSQASEGVAAGLDEVSILEGLTRKSLKNKA